MPTSHYYTPHFSLLRCLLLAGYLALLPSLALAYVDPGSGMLLIQSLVAIVGALIVFVRNPIKTIKALISRWRNRGK